MLVFMDQLVQATRAKIQDVRSDSPGRPIILVGFNTGSALACQVSFLPNLMRFRLETAPRRREEVCSFESVGRDCFLDL